MKSDNVVNSNAIYVNPSEALWEFVSSMAADEDLRLYDLIKPRANALRVFIDKPKTEIDKKGSGVTSGDCSTLCRRLMHAFGVEGQNLGISSEPEIEVSSPGLERDLRLAQHFEEAVGHKIKMTTKSGFISGVLEAFSDGILTVKEGDENTKKEKPSVQVNFNDVKKGQLLFY